MSGFTKLVPEIIQSSIWNESSDIRIVWITLLAVKDENGYVRGDVRTIARLANVDVEAAGRAIDAFLSPDPGSHTPDNEGRRIGTAAGGYVVLNHALYRGRDAKAEHAEYVKKWRAEREKQSDVIKCDSQVNHASASASASVSVSDIKKGVQGETPKQERPAPDSIRWVADPGKMWEGIKNEDLDAWGNAYPAVDLDRELTKMHQWILANPDKMKKQWRRFIINWLARSQERGR
jgi:hypothetical protein